MLTESVEGVAQPLDVGRCRRRELLRSEKRDVRPVALCDLTDLAAVRRAHDAIEDPRLPGGGDGVREQWMSRERADVLVLDALRPGARRDQCDGARHTASASSRSASSAGALIPSRCAARTAAPVIAS